MSFPVDLFMGISFVIGLFISIVCAMYAVEKNKMVWNLVPFPYSFLVNGLLMLAYDRNFDVFGSMLFAGVLIVLGWAGVRFEVLPKRKQPTNNRGQTPIKPKPTNNDKL
jgi:FtsH-binding integral membrane protein